MPKVSIFKKLPPEERNALDTEIRARFYSDFAGISQWLEARGVRLAKSAVGLYAKRLRERDEDCSVPAPDPLLTAAAAAVTALESLQGDSPGLPAAAGRQLRIALSNAIAAVHRYRTFLRLTT